jgi:hypothetical protein
VAKNTGIIRQSISLSRRHPGENALQQVKLQICLVVEPAGVGILFAAEIVTGGAIHVNQYAGQPDALEVVPMFGVERLAAASIKAGCPADFRFSSVSSRCS